MSFRFVFQADREWGAFTNGEILPMPDAFGYRIRRMDLGRFWAHVGAVVLFGTAMPRRLFLVSVATIAIGMSLVGVSLLRMSGPVTVPIVIDEVIEKLTLVLGMAAVAWTMHGVRDLREGQEALSRNLARAVAQGEDWRISRRTEIAAFGDAVADQFKSWQLSAAEIDIAGLLLKGCSLKEIALARDTSEATIRQQAQSVYRKSGLSGRAELSAYFLESLFTTADDAAARQAALRVVPGG